MKSRTFAALVLKYSDHPEFLGVQISDPNQRGAVEDTLLHIAARKGDLDDIEVLVAAGAQLNVIGDLGNTPLHQAAMAGNLDAVKKLLQLGSDPRVENEFGETPLKVAELGGHVEVAAFLGRVPLS